MQGKATEVQGFMDLALSVLSSPAAKNGSLMSQIRRGLNKPGVSRDLAFGLMLEDGFAWDAGAMTVTSEPLFVGCEYRAVMLGLSCQNAHKAFQRPFLLLLSLKSSPCKLLQLRS